MCGPAAAVAAVRAVKQFLTYVGSGPFQPAVAVGLGLPDAVFAGLARTLQDKRDRLVDGLRRAGMEVSVPAGGYFVVADAAPLGAVDALSFCHELPARAGVVGVPVSVFHDDPEAGRTLVRFAFCKRDEVLDEACRRLATLAGHADPGSTTRLPDGGVPAGPSSTGAGDAGCRPQAPAARRRCAGRRRTIHGMTGSAAFAAAAAIAASAVGLLGAGLPSAADGPGSLGGAVAPAMPAAGAGAPVSSLAAGGAGSSVVALSRHR